MEVGIERTDAGRYAGGKYGVGDTGNEVSDWGAEVSTEAGCSEGVCEGAGEGGETR